MGEGTANQMVQGAYSIRQYDSYAKREDSWKIKAGPGDDDDHDKDEMSDTTSTTSDRSTYSSSDLVDDASSSASSSCSSSLRSGGSLYDLSDLMVQLPIKQRGLSKYFQGKSQSFTSLSKVNSIEDLAKKETPYQRSKALKSCKSYGGGLGTQRSYNLIPKATISKVKKSSRCPLSSASFSSRRGTSLGITKQ